MCDTTTKNCIDKNLYYVLRSLGTPGDYTCLWNIGWRCFLENISPTKNTLFYQLFFCRGTFCLKCMSKINWETLSSLIYIYIKMIFFFWGMNKIVFIFITSDSYGKLMIHIRNNILYFIHLDFDSNVAYLWVISI